MGAGVRGAGTSEVTIEGRPELGGGEHVVIPDRIEAGTFMVAAAVTGGAVQVAGARADHLEAFLAKLDEAGVVVRERESGIRVEGSGKLAAVGARHDPRVARLPPGSRLRARGGEALGARRRHRARAGGGVSAARLVCPAGGARARARLARLAARGSAAGERVEGDVRRIIARVRRDGDRALLALARRFDGVRLRRAELRVPNETMAAAYRGLLPSVRRDLALAARRIRAFHARQRERSWSFRDASGARLGQRIEPLERVGVYVPGGRAAYPSTVLMTVIPARVAGVGEVIAVSPVGKDGDTPIVLAACHLAGLDRLYRNGGAQAVAALAYGTESVPRVDKIVGPGNVWVATAKRLALGQVDLDSIAGPSEVPVAADGAADAQLVAADMLAQAEHDPLAAAICVTPDRRLAARVAAALDRQLASLPRRAVAARALANFGAIVVVRSLAQALEIANHLAPEHLELAVRAPRRWLARRRHAGAVVP